MDTLRGFRLWKAQRSFFTKLRTYNDYMFVLREICIYSTYLAEGGTLKQWFIRRCKNQYNLLEY